MTTEFDDKKITDEKPIDKPSEEESKSVDDKEVELTLACIISNLASALDNLSEIDAGLLNKRRQEELAMVKRRIFDCMVGYSLHLTEWE